MLADLAEQGMTNPSLGVSTLGPDPGSAVIQLWDVD